MRNRVLATSLALLLSGAGVTQDQTRFDAARFDLPAGWTKTALGQTLRLEPQAKNARVEVGHSVAMPVSIEEYGESLIEQAKQQPGFRIETARQSGPHRASRGRWHSFAYSWADADHAGQFHYAAVLSVAAGGRCVSFTMVTDSTAAYEEHRLALGAMVDGVVLTSGQRLEWGAVPLTRYMVDETIDFLEWLVQSPLTEDQKRTVESELRRSWKESKQSEIEGVQELLAGREQLAGLPEAQRELARGAVLAEALKAWRADADDAGSKMMLAIYDAAHAPIAEGEPPLTRQAVEAFAEFLNFAAGRTIDFDGKLPKETRDQLVAGVAEGYAELPAEQRELIVGMPMVWAAIRVAWPDLSKEQQQQYIDGWKQSGPIAALGKMLEAQKQAAAAKQSSDLFHNQMLMQAEQQRFLMMQNIMQMQYDTSRVIISNFSNNYRYEYRW